MKTILFIIDMQKGFMNENTKHLVPKIVDFVKNNKFHLVIGTRYVNNENTACHIYEGLGGCWEVLRIQNLYLRLESFAIWLFQSIHILVGMEESLSG